jgi:hypothetical protein
MEDQVPSEFPEKAMCNDCAFLWTAFMRRQALKYLFGGTYHLIVSALIDRVRVSSQFSPTW